MLICEDKNGHILNIWSHPGGGATDLGRWYGDVRPWRPPFHTSPAVHKGPISSKRVSSQDPFWENLEILASTASIFAQILALNPPNSEIFSSKAPKFGNFQFTSPPFRRQISVRKPHLLEIRAAHPYLKKVECPHGFHLSHIHPTCMYIDIICDAIKQN